jgi:putative addiction module component (TIGR02574 family)
LGCPRSDEPTGKSVHHGGRLGRRGSVHFGFLTISVCFQGSARAALTDPERQAKIRTHPVRRTPCPWWTGFTVFRYGLAVFDFSHLTPEERIQLAEDLWDSLPIRDVTITDAQRAELERRRQLHEAAPDRGRPWRDVLDEIEGRVR